MHEEVVVAALKDIETQKTRYDVSVSQREDQKEETSSHIQGQSTKVLLQATANIKQTRRKVKPHVKRTNNTNNCLNTRFEKMPLYFMVFIDRNFIVTCSKNGQSGLR